MHQKQTLVILSGLMSLLLAACIPSAVPLATWAPTLRLAHYAPPPVVYTVDGKIFDDPEAVSKRDAACKTLVPVNLQQVIQNSLPNQPIAWRINLNFKAQDKAGNPLGCLRLFEVSPGANSNAPTIQALDEGGFLINTCLSKGDVTIDANRAQATFANQGFIQCTTNIRAWVAALQAHLTNVKNQLAVDLMSHQTAQSYSNLVMYGRGAVWPTGAPWQGYLFAPVAAYQPVAAERAYPPLAMSLLADQGSSWASLYTVMNHTNYHIPAGAANDCVFEKLKALHDWWQDFRSTDNALRFYWRDLSGSNPGLHLCQGLQPALPTGHLLDFWIDEATLTIGYTPKMAYEAPQPGADPEQWFSGILEEFVIDPTDSKPPA